MGQGRAVTGLAAMPQVEDINSALARPLCRRRRRCLRAQDAVPDQLARTYPQKRSRSH